MFANMRGWEPIIILLIVLLLFGARKLPDLARSVGKSLKIFKAEVKDLKEEPGAAPTEPTAEPTDPATDGEPRQP